MNKSFSFIFFLFILIIPAHAQKKQVKAADDAFIEKKYSTALESYRKAYSKVKNDSDEKNRINFQLAECYRYTNNIRRAIIQYKRLEKIKYQEKEPLILLYLADALKSDKKYAEALIRYKTYQQLAPEDERAENGITSCSLAQEWEKNPTNYVIDNLKKINSREDDFSPAYANSTLNTIVFTSSRAAASGSQKDEWTNQDFSDLFITRLERNGNYTPPVLLDNEEEGIDNELKINSSGNEGTPQLNASFTAIYFTRCPSGGTKNQGCKIYTSTRSGRNWSRPKALQFEQDTSSIVGHPTISRDELTIYFSSENKNGYGGKDIWMAKRALKSGSFGKPQNLGPEVNTPGDEMFPFLRNDTLLYFSSNGHIGMGGLDIYRATYNSGWEKVENLRPPLNSSGDDFGIIFHPQKEEGFFSSNRKGAHKTDLYSFYQPLIEYRIEGTVKNENSLLYIEDAEISLVASNGTNNYTTRTNAAGKYQFGSSQVKANLDYEISVSKTDFFAQKQNISSEDISIQQNVIKDFSLVPLPSDPIVLPDILYDLGKWELKPQYQDSLQDLIKTMDENKSLVIELASHTDSRDTDERNDILSQRRARSVVEYLILRGIDPDRLVAKGYGERQPRELKKNITKNGIIFRSGSILTEEFINNLRTNAEKEAAHELNRRSEFRILNKDFQAKTSKTELNPDKVTIKLNPVNNEISFDIDEQGNIKTNCFINERSVQLTYAENFRIEISLRQALRLLNDGNIDKNDFVGDVEKALANGTIANNSVISLRKLSVADKTLNNIEVTVSNRLKNSFQFGNALLSKFGNFTIDKEAKKIIFH